METRRDELQQLVWDIQDLLHFHTSDTAKKD
jgi:hypothetical protein